MNFVESSKEGDKPGGISLTYKNLVDKNIKHSDGSQISKDEIVKGITVTRYTTNTFYFTVSFSSIDKANVKSVANEISNVTLNYFLTSGGEQYENLTIVKQASEPQIASKQITSLFTILAADVMVSYTCAFIYEVVLDQVYDKHDLEELGCSTYELSLSKGK